EKLLEFIRPELPNLVPHFHMSLQSGSPRILKLMRRPYTRELFLEKAEMLLERTPLMSLGTDVIAGYPAETEEDFLETVELLERIPFSYLHVFEFSPRRGTEAFSLKEIHPAERKRRVKILLEIRSRKMREYREKFVGKKLQVIAEKVKNGVLEGTSENYLRIRFEGPESLLGEIVDVTVTGIDENMLTGTVQSQSKAAILRL
ncbi:MAG TPA: radical SAM protein, partial [candidate division WOR-3 bacterium]|nr:radical SAM protein [candidate division WOR-3 bacterium]